MVLSGLAAVSVGIHATNEEQEEDGLSCDELFTDVVTADEGEGEEGKGKAVAMLQKGHDSGG